MQAPTEAIKRRFRGTFTFVGDGETVRAVVLFGVLLTILIAIVVHLSVQQASLNVLEDRLERAKSIPMNFDQLTSITEAAKIIG